MFGLRKKASCIAVVHSKVLLLCQIDHSIAAFNYFLYFASVLCIRLAYSHLQDCFNRLTLLIVLCMCSNVAALSNRKNYL